MIEPIETTEDTENTERKKQKLYVLYALCGLTRLMFHLVALRDSKQRLYSVFYADLGGEL